MLARKFSSTTSKSERQRRSPRLALLAGLLLIALLGAACGDSGGDDGGGGSSRGDEPTRGGEIRIESQEPGSLDPPLAAGSEDARIVRLIYDGLVGYDQKTAALEPRVATEWDSNDDATEWTFKLREGTKFSNGEEVTAESFVRGVTRATSPELYNDPNGLGYHLDGVKGVAERSAGTASEVEGVEAVDDYTLKFTLTTADAEFPVKAGHTPFYPVPSDEAMAAQQPSWPEFPIGNGPFKLKEAWKHNQSITLVRNDEYYGDEAYLDQVNIVITADLDTAYVNWQAGNLDWTRIPPPKTQEARQQNEGNFLIRDMAGLEYLSFTLQQAPMDNKQFRQAVSLSIDRQAISDAVFFGLRTPAAGIVPELMPGSRADGDEGPCKYCEYDPERAKELFEQSGVKLDKLTLHFNAGAGHDEWMAAVAQQISQTLGIPVEAVPATTQFTGSAGYTGWIKDGAPASLNRIGWGLDYPTPDNFLYPLLFSTSSDNKTNYNNPEYDKLVLEARAETDDDARVKLYQDAEDLALEDMPFVPLWWRTQFRLVKLDKYGGLAIDPFEDPTLRTAYIKGEASESPDATTSESTSPTTAASPTGSATPASTEPPASPPVAPSPSPVVTASP